MTSDLLINPIFPKDPQGFFTNTNSSFSYHMVRNEGKLQIVIEEKLEIGESEHLMTALSLSSLA